MAIWRRESRPLMVQLETPIDLASPELYRDSMARHVGRGFSVRSFLMIYYNPFRQHLSLGI